MEKGTRNLLILSSIIGLGGLFYFFASKRNLKALNIYSIGKSTDGKIYLFVTTKSAQSIAKFVQNASPSTAIEELDLTKNPTKSALTAGKTIEVKGIEGLNGTYQVMSTLSPSQNVNRVMAIKIDKATIPSSYINISGGNKDRFYASNASSVGKLIIK
jgi:hypothetical protein